jgi:hypothetical protein
VQEHEPSTQHQQQGAALREANAYQRVAAVQLRSGRSGEAAATLEQSRSRYLASETALNQEFLDLQGELDDKMKGSDTSILKDTLAIQGTRNTQGISVRSRTKTDVDSDTASSGSTSHATTDNTAFPAPQTTSPPPQGARLKLHCNR